MFLTQPGSNAIAPSLPFYKDDFSKIKRVKCPATYISPPSVIRFGVSMEVLTQCGVQHEEDESTNVEELVRASALRIPQISD